MMMKTSSVMADGAASSFSEISFSDFHLYTLSDPVTLLSETNRIYS